MERQYIGIDLHKASFHACAVTETGQRLWEASFPRSADGIAALAAREVAGAQLAVAATGPTWAFVDAVTAIGVQACVADPRKTKFKAGFAAKTDRLDARRLADALRRESVGSIYIPPPAIRQWRELCRGAPRGGERGHNALRADHAAGVAVAALGARGDGLHATKRSDARGRWVRRLAAHKGIQKARVALARVGLATATGGPRLRYSD